MQQSAPAGAGDDDGNGGDNGGGGNDRGVDDDNGSDTTDAKANSDDPKSEASQNQVRILPSRLRL